MKKLLLLTINLLLFVSCSSDDNNVVNDCNIDNTISKSNETLTANTTGSYTYQWLDCNNGNAPIPGETNQSFTPTDSGNYAVEINDGNCSVISDCINISCEYTLMYYLIDDNSDSSLGDIDATNWHHIAYTKAMDRTGQIFVDGQKVAQGIFEDVPYNYTALYLAASYHTSWSGHFKGWIDELRISNTIRTESEINNHYNSGAELPVDASTLGLWHFNESSGTSFSNAITGNGTLINGASFTTGKFGNGVYFDGINDRGDCNISIPENNITIEFWVKLDGTQDATIIQPYGLYSSNINTIYMCD